MERRSLSRIPRRLLCEIRVAGKKSAGIVRDVSRRGLFVQTQLDVTPRTIVTVNFAGSGLQPDLCIDAGVARRRVVPARLQAEVGGGLGLEVIPPWADFERWVHDPARVHLGPSIASEAFALDETSDKGSHEAHEPAIQTFKIRLVKHRTPGAKFLTIRGGTEASARARAMSQFGRGWRVTEIQRL